MPFQVSPGVNVSEIDLTTSVPAVSTTEGALAGLFRWGPVNVPVLIDSEQNLVARFGKPTNLNAETWFTGASFLAYGNKLYISRAANTTANTADTVTNNQANVSFNAIANTETIPGITSTELGNSIIKSKDHYESKTSLDATAYYIAKWPGDVGNSLKVSVCDSATGFNSTRDLQPNSFIGTTSGLYVTVGSNTGQIAIVNSASGTLVHANDVANNVYLDVSVGDYLEVGNTTLGKQYLQVTSTSLFTNATHRCVNVGFSTTYNLAVNYFSNTNIRNWEYFNAVDRAPGTSTYVAQQGNTAAVDEVHVVVVDEDGKFTGVPGTVLEVFQALSRATDAKTQDGSSNYYKNVINDNSSYIWWGNDRAGASSATALLVTSSSATTPLTVSFVLGSDGKDETAVPVSVITAAYDKFISAEDIDISLILSGKAYGGTGGEQIPNYLIDNIAEKRKDCVVFVSPDKADVVSNAGSEASSVVAFRNLLRSTSYAVLDSGYKYMYDKYNDIYRYVPLNGDIAGLAVRTDDIRDPWWSPAGFNRGQIKNIVKLAYNPGKADRDILYKSGVNPVVTFPGQGTILYGDKTLLNKPSAFDRINVRRLFIVLEKAIATAAKFTLFEFNDEFTRARFKNLVEPFLRDVHGRRGIYDFRVVCDETNNTPEVIDRNEFIGDIYIKPAKSINFIQLNFVAVRTGVEFSEIVGGF